MSKVRLSKQLMKQKKLVKQPLRKQPRETISGVEPGWRETKDGLRFDKDQYGLHVDRTHDFPNIHRGQGREIIKPPVGKEMPASLLTDGFTVLDRGKIGDANQAKPVEKFQDQGRKVSRSHTASGYNREHFPAGHE